VGDCRGLIPHEDALPSLLPEFSSFRGQVLSSQPRQNFLCRMLQMFLAEKRSQGLSSTDLSTALIFSVLHNPSERLKWNTQAQERLPRPGGVVVMVVEGPEPGTTREPGLRLDAMANDLRCEIGYRWPPDTRGRGSVPPPGSPCSAAESQNTNRRELQTTTDLHSCQSCPQRLCCPSVRRFRPI